VRAQRTRSRNGREWSDFTEDTNIAVRLTFKAGKMHSELAISVRQRPDQHNPRLNLWLRFAALGNLWSLIQRSPQSSTILPELPDFISSIAFLNCV
jgi:hypothetical protein